MTTRFALLEIVHTPFSPLWCDEFDLPQALIEGNGQNYMVVLDKMAALVANVSQPDRSSGQVMTSPPLQRQSAPTGAYTPTPPRNESPSADALSTTSGLSRGSSPTTKSGAPPKRTSARVQELMKNFTGNN